MSECPSLAKFLKFYFFYLLDILVNFCVLNLAGEGDCFQMADDDEEEKGIIIIIIIIKKFRATPGPNF